MRRLAAVVATALTVTLLIGSGTGAQAAPLVSMAADAGPTLIAHSDATWNQLPSGTGTTNLITKLAASSAAVPMGFAIMDQNPGISASFGTPTLWKSTSSKSFESGLYMLAYPLTSNVYGTSTPAQPVGTREQLQTGSLYVEVFNQNWQLQDTEAQLSFTALQADGQTPSSYTIKSAQYKYKYETLANGIPQVAPQYVNDVVSKTPNGSAGCQAMTGVKVAFDMVVPLVKWGLSLSPMPKPVIVMMEVAIEGLKDVLAVVQKNICG